MDYKKILKQKINNLINGTWTVPQFQKEYYQYFLDRVPDNALTTEEMDFFGLVQEKLDWTSENPSGEEKKYGWFSYPEYIEWLKKMLKIFKKTRTGGTKIIKTYCIIVRTSRQV